MNFEALTGVGRRNVQIADLELLEKLPALQKLQFRGEDVTDDWLARVGKLTRVRELRIGPSPISSRGIHHLRPLKDLRVLDISYSNVDDEAIDPISRLPQLEELDLSETRVSDSGVIKLARLEKLHILTLGNSHGKTTISRASEGVLCNMKSLRKLDIFCTEYDEEGVKVLQKFLPDCKIISRYQSDDDSE